MTATHGDEEIVLSWQAPTSNGGAPITRYIVYVNGSASLTVSATAATLLGLTNGTTYSVSVAAGNYHRIGEAGDSATAEPRTVPDAPQNLRADGNPGGITLTWQAPASDGGRAISGYRVQYKGQTSQLPGTATAYTLTNVTEGETVAFTVFAVNSEGAGASVVATGVALDVPAAPQNLRATRGGSGVINIAWDEPQQLPPGASLQGYVVKYGNVSLNRNASPRTYRADNLVNGRLYTISVYARSSVGDGQVATTTAKPATTPNAPAVVVGSAGKRADDFGSFAIQQRRRDGYILRGCLERRRGEFCRKRRCGDRGCNGLEQRHKLQLPRPRR